MRLILIIGLVGLLGWLVIRLVGQADRLIPRGRSSETPPSINTDKIIDAEFEDLDKPEDSSRSGGSQE